MDSSKLCRTATRPPSLRGGPRRDGRRCGRGTTRPTSSSISTCRSAARRKRRPITVGHLGQSLDGFIATHDGDSQFVTGRENIVHLHRLRALCDAVVVGAGTVAADDPQLTTRHVAGPQPAARRVRSGAPPRRPTTASSTTSRRRRFTSAPGRSSGQGRRTSAAPTSSRSTTTATWTSPSYSACCGTRGCRRILVEGGGVTVSKLPEGEPARSAAGRRRAVHHRRRTARDPSARPRSCSATATALAIACSAWASDVLFELVIRD